MLVLVIAPFFTSFLVRTLAWKSILSDNGFVVDDPEDAAHPRPEDGRLLATSFAVVTGLTYNFLPFMVLPLYASLEKIDLRLIEAGKDLYANGFTPFRKITLPLSMPGVVAGTLLTFIPAAGDYINSKLLGTPQQNMIGNVIDNTFLVQLDYPAAASCSVHLDGGDRRDGARLRAPRGDGGPAVRGSRVGRWLGDHVIMGIAIVVLVYMFLPIFFVVLMSFNDAREPARPTLSTRSPGTTG